MSHQFEGYVHFSTARAILFQSHYWEHAHWFPRSQIEIVPTTDDEETVIIASAWISRMKNVREFEYNDREPEPF